LRLFADIVEKGSFIAARSRFIGARRVARRWRKPKLNMRPRFPSVYVKFPVKGGQGVCGHLDDNSLDVTGQPGDRGEPDLTYVRVKAPNGET